MDRKAFDEASDVFEWLTQTRTLVERGSFIRLTVFPALLSDFLHFIYEALAASQRAKLTVAYALLRKPLQDTLGLLEQLVIDPDGFVGAFSNDPLTLRPSKSGGVEQHAKRIASVLGLMKEDDRFDAEFLAMLRYDKSSRGSFDGPCNQALHLLTEHRAIRTEPLNFNFVFTDDDARQSQWYFLYSRLPYVLYYARLLFEHALKEFGLTDPVYRADMERRLAAATILWAPAIDESWKHAALDRLVKTTMVRIVTECIDKSTRMPTLPDLARMRDTGAMPGEFRAVTVGRHLRYRLFGAVATAATHADNLELRVRDLIKRFRTIRHHDGG
ncbi:MAG: hypothetical protein QM784_36975 [Polyangiaceae bacterium]